MLIGKIGEKLFKRGRVELEKDEIVATDFKDKDFRLADIGAKFFEHFVDNWIGSSNLHKNMSIALIGHYVIRATSRTTVLVTSTSQQQCHGYVKKHYENTPGGGSTPPENSRKSSTTPEQKKLRDLTTLKTF